MDAPDGKCLKYSFVYTANDMYLYPGNNALMRMLYEVDLSKSTLPQQQSVIEVPSLWRYREQISLQHALRSLENMQPGNNNASEQNKKKRPHPHPLLILFFREVRFYNNQLITMFLITTHFVIKMRLICVTSMFSLFGWQHFTA